MTIPSDTPITKAGLQGAEEDPSLSSAGPEVETRVNLASAVQMSGLGMRGHV